MRRFVRALRSRPLLADVPIIVVTVYQDREFCYRALEAGATDFLLSPVDHLEFRARARNLLMLRRQQLMLTERAADLERALSTHQGVQQQDAMQRLLDAMPAAVSVVDAHGRLVLVNAAYERALGIDRLTALGRPIQDSHSEDYALQNGVLDEKVLQTGLPIALPFYETLTGTGSTRWLLTTKAPLGGGSGRAMRGADRGDGRYRTACCGSSDRGAVAGGFADRAAERRLLSDPVWSTSWPVHGASMRCSPCCISISTVSRGSTTRSARSSAPTCCARSPRRLQGPADRNRDAGAGSRATSS